MTAGDGYAPTRLVLFGSIALFCAGVLLRGLYIFEWSPAMENLFSDMGYYHQCARDFGRPDFRSGVGETVHPPGTRWFFGVLMSLDRSMTLSMVVQFAMASALPLVLMGVALDLFGKRTALCALGMASLYFPLFDYSAYFLSEGPFAFALLVAFWLLVRSLRTGGVASVVLGLTAGLALGVAASFKSVVLPAAVLVLVVLLLLSRARGLRIGPTVAASLAGLALVVTPLAVRATKLSDGRFTLIANDAARNVLLGHYGDIGTATFRDHDRGSVYTFGSPSAAQKGFDEAVEFPVGPYDNSELMRYATDWIAAHPAAALALSFEHMFDLFYGTYAWPSVVTGKRGWVVLFSQVFLVLVLFPAAMHVCRNARGLCTLQPHLSGDLLVLMPILAILFAAFLTLGEPRYRVPFDTFFLLLAARAYCGHHRAESRLLPDSP